MESMDLPIWMELSTATPMVVEETVVSEEFTLFHDTDFADQFLNLEPDESSPPSPQPPPPPPPACRPEQLLMELEQEIIKDDEWVLDPELLAAVVDETSPKSTEELLFEFDAVCNAVGLTPPASPPAKFLEGAPIYYVDEVDPEILLQDDEELSNDFIDELVRSRSSSLDSCDTSSASSTSSSPRSDASFDVSGFDDDEWTPAEQKKPSPPTEKRKKRPYGRPVEEKKVRKKEQNKNAATRYRQKKKHQLETILSEEDQLKAVHVQLKTKYDDTRREINYLKKLMKEILIAKGVSIQ